jgi:hypothetical protein
MTPNPLDPNAEASLDPDAAASLWRLVLAFESLPPAQRALAEDYTAAIAAKDEARATDLEARVGMGETGAG